MNTPFASQAGRIKCETRCAGTQRVAQSGTKEVSLADASHSTTVANNLFDVHARITASVLLDQMEV